MRSASPVRSARETGRRSTASSPRTLPASTLSEVLVVMILMGIVLLSLFEGLSLFGKLSRRITGELELAAEQSVILDSLFIAQPPPPIGEWAEQRMAEIEEMYETDESR